MRLVNNGHKNKVYVDNILIVYRLSKSFKRLYIEIPVYNKNVQYVSKLNLSYDRWLHLFNGWIREKHFENSINL